jgi:hypothetical protein
MGQRTSVYLDDDLHAAVKASGIPLAELVRRGLTASSPSEEAVPAPAPTGSAASLAAIGQGEPSPGVACAGPGCWQRNTSRYGLRRVPLCPACAAALRGQGYKREPLPGAARLSTAKLGGRRARRRADCHSHRVAAGGSQEYVDVPAAVCPVAV